MGDQVFLTNDGITEDEYGETTWSKTRIRGALSSGAGLAEVLVADWHSPEWRQMIRTVGKSHDILFKRGTADSAAPTNFPRYTPPFEGGTRPVRFLKPIPPK